MAKYSFTNEWVENVFKKVILPHMKAYPYVKFRCFNPADLTKDDVWDIQDALKAELGRRYVVEPKRKVTHISPDGVKEYERRRRKAIDYYGWRNWPADWYDDVKRQEEEDWEWLMKQGALDNYEGGY